MAGFYGHVCQQPSAKKSLGAADTSVRATPPQPVGPFPVNVRGGKIRPMLHWRSLFILIAFVALAAGARVTSKSIQKAKGFSWASRASTHFDVFVEAGGLAERDLQKVVAVLENSHANLERLLGSPLQERSQYFLVSSRARMKELIGFEANGVNNGPVSIGVYNEDVKIVASHEICHWQARNLWGRNQGLWINEGLAVYSDNQWNGLPLHLVAKWLLDHDKLIPLSDLLPDGWPKKYSDLITYPELGSFVKFTYERYGRDAVKALWQKGAKQAPASIGKNREELEREWRAELAKLDASSLNYKL